MMRVKLKEIKKLSPTIKTFVLEPESDYVKYFAGQFLTVHTGAGVNRAYSFSSSPTNPGAYEITVKLIKDGLGSTWMHNELKEGDILEVSKPAGKFTLQQAALSSIFVAGGIGITPLLSMLKYALASGDTRKLFFFYASRHLEDLVFDGEIADLAKQYPNLTYVPIISGDKDLAWEGRRGRISQELMDEVGVNFKRAEVYTCGPNAMMDNVEEFALDAGLKKSDFHKEQFVLANGDTDKLNETYNVRYNGVDYEYTEKQNLLDFLHAQGLRVRHSCKVGICSSCTVHLKEGEVDMGDNSFFNEEELAEGKRLACVSYPKSDIVLEKNN